MGIKAALPLVFFGMFLVGCNKEQASSPQIPGTSATQNVTGKPADYMTIGLTPDEFKAAFNAEAQGNESAFRIVALDVKQAETGMQFVYQFDSNITILGTINQYDGTIRSISTLATVGGERESAVKVPLIMHDIIRATNPTLPEKDTAAMALKLFQESVKHLENPVEDVRNGLRYAALFAKGKGMIFIVDQKR